MLIKHCVCLFLNLVKHPGFFCQFNDRLLFFSTCDRIPFPLGGPELATQKCVLDPVFTLFFPMGIPAVDLRRYDIRIQRTSVLESVAESNPFVASLPMNVFPRVIGLPHFAGKEIHES